MLQTSENPLVSVVIPIYGQCSYTLLCLASMAKHSPSIPFEVIVVDDYSPDYSREIINCVANIKFINNTKNEGFIRSCNAGAKSAKGKYVRSEEHTSELKSLMRRSYDVFCLKKKEKQTTTITQNKKTKIQYY